MLKRQELSDPKSCLSKADCDEPLFILRATDKAAPGTIRMWVEERIAMGLNTRSDEKMVSAAALADEMQEYQK